MYGEPDMIQVSRQNNNKGVIRKKAREWLETQAAALRQVHCMRIALHYRYWRAILYILYSTNNYTMQPTESLNSPNIWMMQIVFYLQFVESLCEVFDSLFYSLPSDQQTPET